MSTAPWLIGSLLEGTLDGSNIHLFRVVFMQPSENLVYLLEVKRNITPHSTQVPQSCPLDRARAQLQLIDECIRLEEMEAADDELSPEWLAGQDRRYALIADLVTPEVLPKMLHRRHRRQLIDDQAARHNVEQAYLRRLLTRYWWYGCDRRSLLQLRSRQGAPGQPRTEASQSKRGRPNAIAKHNPQSPRKGVNVTERHLRIFRQALDLYWRNGSTLAEAYASMESNLYRKTISKPDGTVVPYQIAKQFIPTKEQFFYHSRRILREPGWKQSKLSELDFMTQEAARTGSARDIAAGPGDIFDIDATEFNFELVASWNPRLRIGKPTTYIVIDRASTAIVGVYAEPRAERWEGYRRALYSAFTPKTKLLERCGLLETFPDLWPFHAVPNAVFSDRGPARSNDALQALCDELKLEKATAPPHRPDLNAVVESLQKKVQDLLSEMSGGYKRTRDEQSRRRASAARRNAVLNEQQFMRLLVAAIGEHNQSADVRHLLTAKMGPRVRAVPQDIFLWGMQNSAVNYMRFRNGAELYAKLLPSRQLCVYQDGVRYQNARYSSERLQYWRQHEVRKNKKVKVYIDADPHFLYWQPSAGQWEELVMSATDQARVAGMSWTDIEKHLEKVAAEAIHIAHRRHKRGVLARTKEATLRDIERNRLAASGYQPHKQSIDSNRSFEARKQQSHQQKEGRETMLELTDSPEQRSLPDPNAAQAPAPQRPTENGEPSLADLRKRHFQ